MQKYYELIVWQKAMVLVKSIYQMTRKLPKDEIYALSDQMRRAAVSVPSNIAEGFGRDSSKEYVHFLSISRGSVYELETQIRVAIMHEYISTEESSDALSLCEECGKMLNAMIRKITDP